MEAGGEVSAGDIEAMNAGSGADAERRGLIAEVEVDVGVDNGGCGLVRRWGTGLITDEVECGCVGLHVR